MNICPSLTSTNNQNTSVSPNYSHIAVNAMSAQSHFLVYPELYPAQLYREEDPASSSYPYHNDVKSASYHQHGFTLSDSLSPNSIPSTPSSSSSFVNNYYSQFQELDLSDISSPCSMLRASSTRSTAPINAWLQGEGHQAWFEAPLPCNHDSGPSNGHIQDPAVSVSSLGYLLFNHTESSNGTQRSLSMFPDLPMGGFKHSTMSSMEIPDVEQYMNEYPWSSEHLIPYGRAEDSIQPEAALNIHGAQMTSSLPSRSSCRRKSTTCAHCDRQSIPVRDMPHHLRTTHPELLQCYECYERFSVVEHLNRHALQKKHQAFECQTLTCSATFTRLDDLRRHIRKHQSNSKRSQCPHCEKSFSRNDHLTQHLRTFHRMGLLPGSSASPRSCPHPACPLYRLPDDVSLDKMPFSQSKEFIEHMRRVHDESPFPCSEPGCSKIGSKGYFREMDLVKHRKKVHAAVQSPEDEDWILQSIAPVSDTSV